MTFDGAGHATWTDVTEPDGVTSLDPILWTDRDTGRTISSQLLLACSKAVFTDDDGAHLAAVAGLRHGTGIDHQTIGGGPFAGVLQRRHAVYPTPSTTARRTAPSPRTARRAPTAA